MNYFFCHKWIFILGIICLLSAFAYALFNRLDDLSDDAFLIAEGNGSRALVSLKEFNLEKPERWNEHLAEGDLFSSKMSSVFRVCVADKGLDIVSDENVIEQVLSTMQLDGWTNIEGEMIFVFSSTELNMSCLGSVGDSFEEPAFTILSYDLKTVENHGGGYSIPLVTILDKKLNEQVVLAPASCVGLFQ